jgi:hypothetical protein
MILSTNYPQFSGHHIGNGCNGRGTLDKAPFLHIGVAVIGGRVPFPPEAHSTTTSSDSFFEIID